MISWAIAIFTNPPEPTMPTGYSPRSPFGQGGGRLAEETDYDNFKSEVARHQGKGGAAYERSLHEVWSVMNRLKI